MLITFEGIEGSGKSTQIKLLYEYLKLKGHDVIQTREPGGTIFGERLRDIFLKQDANIFPLTELLVIMAMRAQLVEELIIPALNAGKTVLCDRFSDASYVYQGYGRGIDLGVIESLNRLATKGIRPDLTILIDCTVEEGFRRKIANGFSIDRFEKENRDFHMKIRRMYIKVSKDDPKRFFVVDGQKGVEDIHMLIRKKVEGLLEGYGI